MSDKAHIFSEPSNDFFKEVIELAPDAVFKTDKLGRINYLNESAHSILGYTKANLLSKNITDYINPLYKKDFLSFYHRQIKYKMPFTSFRCPFIMQEGQEIWLELKTRLIKEGEEARGFMLFARDITDDVKRNAMLNAVNNLAASILGKIDLDEIVHEITKNTIRILGFEDCVVYLFNEDKTKLVQHAAYGPKNPDGNEVINKIEIPLGIGIVGHVGQSGEAEIVADTTLDPRYIIDDNVRQSEIAVPIYYENELIGVIDSEHTSKNYYTQAHLETLVAIANIAANQLKSALTYKEKQKAERALIENEMRLRQMFDSSLDAIISVNSQACIVEWNPTAAQLLEYSKQEVEGKRLCEIILPDKYAKGKVQAFIRHIQRGNSGLLNKRFQFDARTKSGKIIPVEMNLSSIKLKKGEFFTAFIRDITEQRQARKKIESALQAERELNKLKTRFVSMASHEIKTPLTSIQANIELMGLKVSLESLSPKEFQEHLEPILGQITRLDTLVNDILTLGKMEGEALPWKPSRTELITLCNSLVQENFNPEQTGYEVVLEAPKTELYLQIDKNLFEMAFVNIVSNAIKYSNHPPAIAIVPTKEQVKLVIKDQGIGIEQEELPHLCDSFYRGSNTQDIEGTGLGLSIAKQMLDRHGASFTIESELNKGTQVTIIFNR